MKLYNTGDEAGLTQADPFISKQCLIIIIITRAGPSLRPVLPWQPNSQITSLFTVRCLGSAHFWELSPIKLWYLK